MRILSLNVMKHLADRAFLALAMYFSRSSVPSATGKTFQTERFSSGPVLQLLRVDPAMQATLVGNEQLVAGRIHTSTPLHQAQKANMKTQRRPIRAACHQVSCFEFAS